MHFKGHLLLPGDSGPGLSVDLDVAEHHLAVESEGGGLGAWPLEVVDVERLDSDVFALTVAGEPLRFVAEDSIAFAYTGIPTIERVSRRPRARAGFRSILDRIWNGPDKSTPTTDSPADPIPETGPARSAEDPSPLLAGPSIPGVIEEIAGDVADNGVVADDEVTQPDESEVSETPAASDDISETRCRAVRGDGRLCESPILTSSGYCYPHDPKRAFDDKYKAAQDARARIKEEATGRLNRIYSRLDKAMRQVERGELDPETAMAMAQLARTMCAILEVDEPAVNDQR